MGFNFRILAAIATASLCLVSATAARPQSPADTQAGATQADRSSTAVATPRLSNGQPDLNGTWDTSSGHMKASADHPAAEKGKDGSIVVLYNRAPGFAKPLPGAPPRVVANAPS